MLNFYRSSYLIAYIYAPPTDNSKRITSSPHIIYFCRLWNPFPLIIFLKVFCDCHNVSNLSSPAISPRIAMLYLLSCSPLVSVVYILLHWVQMRGQAYLSLKWEVSKGIWVERHFPKKSRSLIGELCMQASFLAFKYHSG